MQQWLTEDSVELQLVDSFRPVRHRGTFQARTSKIWFELDTLLVSPALLPRVNSIRQFDSAITDHRGKLYFIRLACDHCHELRQLKRQAAVRTQIPLALHRMSCTTKEAHDFRELYRSELDRRTSLWPAVHDPLADRLWCGNGIVP